jgi:hypothetical protein
MLKKPEVDLPTTNEEYIINLRDIFRKAFEIAAKNTEIKVELSRIQYNRTSFACTFEPGQKVWMRDFKPDPRPVSKILQRLERAIHDHTAHRRSNLQAQARKSQRKNDHNAPE